MAENLETDRFIDTRLRVLTWNLWWRFGPWEQRQPAIAQSIIEIDPDIVALQEVWSDETTNFAAELAKRMDYHHFFASGKTMDGFGFGNAVLSRWPIAKEGSKKLFGLEEANEGRLVVFAEVAGPRGPVPAFSTHLNWRFNHSNIRQRQVAELAQYVDEVRPLTFPPIVCGDFNAESASDEIRMLTGMTSCPVDGLVFHDAWAVAGGEGHGVTWDNRNPYAVVKYEPDRRIDYVFVGWRGSGGEGQIVDCRVAGNKPVDGVWPSDHHAVVAELRY